MKSDKYIHSLGPISKVRSFIFLQTKLSTINFAFISQEEEDKFSDLGTGNRIATMLYYVSCYIISLIYREYKHFKGARVICCQTLAHQML